VTVPATLVVSGGEAWIAIEHVMTLSSTEEFTTVAAATLHPLGPVPWATGAGTIELAVEGDFGDPEEVSTATLEGQFLGTLGAVGGECVSDTLTRPLSAAAINDKGADGVLEVRFGNSGSVDATCAVNRHTTVLTYPIGDPNRIDFGEITVGGSATEFLLVGNEGSAPLEVTSVATDQSEFAASPSSFTLSAGLSRIVDVTFAPAASGPVTGTLTIESNDPLRSQIAIDLIGEGLSGSGAGHGGGSPEGIPGGRSGALDLRAPSREAVELISRMRRGESVGPMSGSPAGEDLFPGGRFIGMPFTPDPVDPLRSSCNIPNGLPGERVTVIDFTAPPAGSAAFYMVAHSSRNALASAPLGARPAVSNRAGMIVFANPCP
jgi:hypothetical protein